MACSCKHNQEDIENFYKMISDFREMISIKQCSIMTMAFLTEHIRCGITQTLIWFYNVLMIL